ncbi:hypothetical protein ACP70R_047781 [Stipagrostis hirtigluma subsp. patula]
MVGCVGTHDHHDRELDFKDSGDSKKENVGPRPSPSPTGKVTYSPSPSPDQTSRPPSLGAAISNLLLLCLLRRPASASEMDPRHLPSGDVETMPLGVSSRSPPHTAPDSPLPWSLLSSPIYSPQRWMPPTDDLDALAGGSWTFNDWPNSSPEMVTGHSVGNHAAQGISAESPVAVLPASGRPVVLFGVLIDSWIYKAELVLDLDDSAGGAPTNHAAAASVPVPVQGSGAGPLGLFSSTESGVSSDVCGRERLHIAPEIVVGASSSDAVVLSPTTKQHPPRMDHYDPWMVFDEQMGSFFDSPVGFCSTWNWDDCHILHHDEMSPASATPKHAAAALVAAQGTTGGSLCQQAVNLKRIDVVHPSSQVSPSRGISGHPLPSTEKEIRGENKIAISSSKHVEVQQGAMSRKRTKRSKVWRHFTEVEDPDGFKAKCKHCGNLLRADSRKDGTSRLRRHIIDFHKMELAGS